MTRPRLIDLKTVHHQTGIISIAEKGSEVPFEINRVYFLHGLSKGSERGSHAHRSLEQVMIAASGAFRVKLIGLDWEEDFQLNDPCVGLYIPPFAWRELSEFSRNSVCLVLASRVYEESDYIRSFEDFNVLRGPQS